MGKTIEELLEELRTLGDVTVILHQTETEGDTYRVSLSWWPGQGDQPTVRARGNNLGETLVAVRKAYDAVQLEATA